MDEARGSVSFLAVQRALQPYAPYLSAPALAQMRTSLEDSVGFAKSLGPVAAAIALVLVGRASRSGDLPSGSKLASLTGALARSLGALPDLQQSVLTCLYFDGATVHEAAQKLGWTYAEVLAAMQSGLESVAASMESLEPGSASVRGRDRSIW